MSTPKSNVDERVVQMRFDNAQFEKNVATTRLSLDKLNKSLELKDAGKGIQNIDSAIRNVDFAGFSSGIETLHSKFSALEVMGITAIANITNSAIVMGTKIASALTIEPVHTGFQEYETQINAIQTILANTESKGSTLKDVNEALNELNHYADLTIYNFTEMTRNIGTFTAAGVDLDTSVAAIKGIANLAAVSGSTSQQASTAMYQLSQALASGTVKLQDWNSVVNAGMGGQVFQDALKETARVHSVNIDAMIKKEGSFRETLKKGWLTSSILTETLSKFTGDLTESQLKEIGYTDKQIKSIVKMGQTANDAATKVKTLSQLIDTSKEAAQSGWTKTWELIVGDFDEAKEFFTWLSDSVSNGINASSDKRNNLLEGTLLNNWTKLTKAINKAGIETQTFEDKVKSIGKKQGYDIGKLIKEYGSLEKVFKNGAVSTNVLKKAFKELTTATSGLDKIDKVLRKGSSGKNVKNIQKILKEIDLDIGSSGADGVFGEKTQSAVEAFQKMKGLKVDGVVGSDTIKALEEASSSSSKLDKNIEDLIDSVTELGGREKLIESLKNSLSFLGQIAKPLKESFRKMFPGITEEELTGVINKIYAFTKNLKLADETADNLRRTFDGGFAIVQMFGKGLSALATPFKVIFDSGIIGKGVSSFLELTASFGDFLSILNESENAGDVFTNISEGLSDFTNGVVNVIDPALSGIENCGGALGYFGNLVLTVGKKVGDGLSWISEFVGDNISFKDVLMGLIGGGTISLLKEFTNVFGNINEILEKFGNKSKSSSLKEGFADVLSSLKTTINSFTSGIKITQILPIAFSLLALTTAIEKLSKIKVEKIAKSLLGLYVSFKMLTSSTEKINDMLSGNRRPIKGLFSTGVLLITLATSLNIFASAVKKISDVPADRIASSLVILGGGITMLCLGIQQITKNDSKNVSLSTSIALLALAESCKIMAEALASIGSLSWEELGKGLTGMGGALVELVAATSVLGKFGGFGSVLGATGILIAVQSLKDISEALSDIGSLSWEQIEKGLTGIGGAFTELTVVLGVLSKAGGFGSVLGATGILIAVQSLNEIADCLSSIGSLSWEEIGKGLIGMGGALIEIASVVGLLGTFGGFNSLIGAGSILIAAKSLNEIADCLSSIGSLSWEQIAKGLVGMGGALTELVVACEILGNPNCLSQLVGATTVLIAVQSLNEIADCLLSIGSLSWEEIAKGLVGMGGALTELAVISELLGTLSGVGGLLGAGSLLIASQGLGDLADALGKFGEMDWGSIGRGLTAMGAAMGEAAIGGVLNTFSGFGASSIEKIATPLGNLADSMKKWSGVVVPDKIGWQLGNLASGVNEFLLSGTGASAIETLAIPLGNLAMSVMRWRNVVLPDGLRENLKELAEGTNAFMFGGLGSMGMDLIVTPLGQLADAAKKWSGFTLPENIESMMRGLANGVNAFLLTGLSADSISTIKKPLGELATSASKWKDVVIPENIQIGLEGLANGIRACNGMNVDLQAMSNSVEKIRNVIDSLSTVNFEDATSKLSSFGSSIKTLDISSSGESLMASIATGVNKSGTKVYTALLSGISSGLKKITSKKIDFMECGGVLVTGLATGIKNNSFKVSNAASASALSSVSAARSYRTSFYLAGEYLVSGFASGIRDNIDSAKNASKDMASAAARAAKKELDEHSPSKVFYGIGDFAGLGFVNALGGYAEESYKAGQRIASSARSGLEKSIDTVMNLVGNGFDDTPTIRPILDLTRIKEGASQINSLLRIGQTVQLTTNIGAITTAMNNQNGSNDDVISAINRLGKSLSNIGGNHYTVNGITYDDGSNVTDAVKSLVRAAKIERRR